MKSDPKNAPANASLDPDNLPASTGPALEVGKPLESLFPEPIVKGGASPTSPAPESPAVDPAAPFGRKADGTPKKCFGRSGKAGATRGKAPAAPSPAALPADSPTPAPAAPQGPAAPLPKGANDPLPTDPAAVEVVEGAEGDNARPAGADKAAANARRLARAFTVILYGFGVLIFGPDFNEGDEKTRRANLESSAETYFLERPDLSLTPGLAFGLEVVAWVTDKARLPVVRERVVKFWTWMKSKQAPAPTSPALPRS